MGREPVAAIEKASADWLANGGNKIVEKPTNRIKNTSHYNPHREITLYVIAQWGIFCWSLANIVLYR